MKKYWFKFEKLDKPSAINLGCGVTANDYEDAIHLLREYVFGENGPPPITQFVQDIDLSKLEANHVRPNVGAVNVRGIWFPQGYDKPRIKTE